MNKRTIIKYVGISLLTALLTALLLIFYQYFINFFDETENELKKEHEEALRNSNIKRLHFLKYSHPHHISDDDGMSLFLIETVQIDNCKYIILSKKDQSPTIIHANDCDYCLKSKK